PHIIIHLSFTTSMITNINTLSLHYALPIYDLLPNLHTSTDIYVILIGDIYDKAQHIITELREMGVNTEVNLGGRKLDKEIKTAVDRKSTRLNSSHQIISYAVFCLKKKKKQQ